MTKGAVFRCVAASGGSQWRGVNAPTATATTTPDGPHWSLVVLRLNFEQQPPRAHRCGPCLRPWT